MRMSLSQFPVCIINPRSKKKNGSSVFSFIHCKKCVPFFFFLYEARLCLPGMGSIPARRRRNDRKFLPPRLSQLFQRLSRPYYPPFELSVRYFMYSRPFCFPPPLSPSSLIVFGIGNLSTVR